MLRVVCDLETSRMRRLKARYRAVKITTPMGFNAKKTNKQTTYLTMLSLTRIKR